MKVRDNFWLGYASGILWAVAFTTVAGAFGNAIPGMIGVSIGALAVGARELLGLHPKAGSDE